MRSKRRLEWDQTHRPYRPPEDQVVSEEPSSSEDLAGCVTTLSVLGAFVTGICGLVMALREGGVKGGLSLVAAALVFGLLAVAYLRRS